MPLAIVQARHTHATGNKLHGMPIGTALGVEQDDAKINEIKNDL